MISISSDLMIEKQMIRSKLLEKRRMMEKEDVLNKSRSIQHKLEQDPVFQTSKNILFYVSYGNEVYTHSLIKKYLEIKKQVLVPRSNKKFNKIDSVIITNWGDLKKGTYEILEPPIAYIPFANKIDLIILPGLAFDISGNRIGHGKGYYDRLINEHPESIIIGLAYEFQIIKNIPKKPHDQRIHKILTEKRIILCQS